MNRPVSLITAAILLLAAGLPAVLYAGPESLVEDITVIPPEYSIGDAVTLRITLSEAAPAGGETPYLPREDKWFQVKTIDTVERGGKVFIFLQVLPFFPGPRMFPPVQYGEQTITGIELHPAALLDKGDYSFASIRETMLLPGSRLYLLLFGLGCAAAAACIVVCVKRFPLLYHRAVQRFGRWKGRLDRRKKLRYLLRNCSELPRRDVYRQLTAAAKETIQTVRGFACSHLTTTEIAGWVTAEELRELVPGSYLVPVLRRADEVRFGNKTVSCSRMEKDIRSIETFAFLLEKPRQAEKIHPSKLHGGPRC
jgi:hypothetical protein